MHGIRVLMAKDYIDNLSEEVLKGQEEKASQGYWPTKAPFWIPKRRRSGGKARDRSGSRNRAHCSKNILVVSL